MRGIVGFVDRPQLSCSWWRSAPGPGHRRLGRPATTRGALLRTGAVGALVALVVGTLGPVGLDAPAAALTVPHHATYSSALSTGSAGTVWLCRPGLPADPCTSSLQTTVVQASGATSVINASVDTASKFDCFYVYPTVSGEKTFNTDLRIQKSETNVAIEQASRFSSVCRVWAPMYRQFTTFFLETLVGKGLSKATDYAVLDTAYESLKSGFEDYLAHYNDGRPIVFIGHSQGASMLIELLKQLVEDNSALNSRVVLAIILGGNVVVPTGSLEGGSFSHIPVCSATGQAGCVIAYSSFPSQPPAASLFGRPGQGMSLLLSQKATTGVQVVCVNPAAIGGGSGMLDAFFPAAKGVMSTPWVEYPGLYGARCDSAGGATWLQVTKISGASDQRPVVTEELGPDWGYHLDDVNLALGNLVADTAAAETSWLKGAHG